MVIGLILLSAALLAIDSRLRSALIAYASFTGATLWLAFPHDASWTALAFFATLAVVKLVFGPAALIWLVRRYKVPEDLAPSINLAWRLLLVVGTLLAAHEIRQMTAFSNVPAAGVVFYAIFTSMLIVLLHRNLLAHVIGLLMLGSAITLAGAVFAPGLPGAIEIADTFDAVIATVVALSLARALIAFNPNLDVRSMRELRG
jgi:hydrogenase-4 membrane subunit HyfE